MRGWVRLHRKTMQSQVFEDPHLLKTWMFCLFRASFRRRWVSIRTGKGTTQVELQPGQFVCGRKAAAKRLRMPEGTIYDRLNKLAKIGCINKQSNRHYTLVSVCNWGRYQNSKIASQQQAPQRTSNQPSTNQQPTNIKKNGGKKVSKKDHKNIQQAAEIEFPQALDSPACRAAWDEWLAYKREIGEPYKSSKSAVAQLKRQAKVGPARFIAAVEYTIAQGYKGICEEKTNGKPTSKPDGPVAPTLFDP